MERAALDLPGVQLTGAGALGQRVAFDAPGSTVGPGGVVSSTWQRHHECRAQLIYQRGSEVVEAARLEGRPIYKVKIRSCAAARAITTDYRMIDLHRADTAYAVIEVDAITDPMWVYVVVEGGKAA
ncbi:head-tail adaptor protein [Thioclava sp. DLFJ4-1]|uniref:phage head completion protein n=1 Tax=Thioclava sp. DLFJ4-1 TaxID=1915313 RepID=UPI00248BDBCA|nr:head-tail adaptor protein [Thioclava sp. DLFJ4-1]